jgi:hypothetical protein
MGSSQQVAATGMHGKRLEVIWNFDLYKLLSSSLQIQRFEIS